jgi:hypothetical protein
MTGKPGTPGAPRAPDPPAALSRAERQKAALKANMARRKAQARARAEETDERSGDSRQDRNE